MPDHPQAPARRPQIPALTSLRFFAALSIVVLHATNHGLLPPVWAELIDLSKAVSFFFVLSGFVLGYAYIGRSYSVRRFYQARWARVWPAAALSILVVPVVLPPALYLPQLGGGWSPGWVLLLALLGLQSLVPIPDVFFGLNAVTWSISTEAAFYALFPWLQREVMRRPWRAVLLVLLLGLTLAGLAVQLNLPGFAAHRLNQPVWEGLVYVNPLARLGEFLAGLLAARWFVSPGVQARLQSLPLGRGSEHRWQAALLEMLGLGLAVLAPQVLVRSQLLKAWAVPGPLQLLLLQWVYGLSFAAVIVVIALQRGLISQLLRWAPLVLLGEISYGLYLYHQVVMIRLVQGPQLSWHGVPLPRPNFGWVLAISLGLAAVSWLGVERSCMRLFRPAGAA